MAEVNIRIMQDANGVQYYPITHVEAVDGLDEDGLISRIVDLEETVISLQNQINAILASM